jgi:hypothetical protein
VFAKFPSQEAKKVYTNLQFIIFHSEVESLFDWTMPDNVFSNYFHRITLPTTVIYLLSLDLLQLYHLKATRSIAGTLSISSHSRCKNKVSCDANSACLQSFHHRRPKRFIQICSLLSFIPRLNPYLTGLCRIMYFRIISIE